MEQIIQISVNKNSKIIWLLLRLSRLIVASVIVSRILNNSKEWLMFTQSTLLVQKSLMIKQENVTGSTKLMPFQ